jgi:dsDNA-binding SOS-regulon protein
LLSWGEQDTFVIMRRTRYICYHGENKIHFLSWGEQDTFDEMIMMCALFLTNTQLNFNSASSLKQESAVNMSFHSDTLFFFRANKSLPLLLSSA